MKPLRFYEHFACAYGSLWLATMTLALLTRSHIDTGVFGLFGFPLISLIYAFVRRSGDIDKHDEIRAIRSDLEALRNEKE